MINTPLKRVLIIDDDESIREYLHCMLEDEGYSVLEAENGSEGLDHMVTHPIDVIITDLIMPEKEGIETIREIRELYPDCRIIAMSGAINSESYLMITKALGAHAIIRKPFLREAVLTAVQSVQQGS